MDYTNKWRETVDPFSLKFNDFKLLEVIGYPPAANDVFYVKGEYKDKIVKAIIKYKRHIEANIENEINIIKSINFDKKPTLLDVNNDKTAEVLLEDNGEKLSTILGDNNGLKSLDYLEEYGETLAKIHQIKGEFNKVLDRKFFHIMDKERFVQNNLLNLYNYLTTNRPKKQNLCFVHGDFHYGNVLWKDHYISCVLDYELSGIGNREFDIAWTIIHRPTQKFLFQKVEMDKFLEGYGKIQKFNYDYVIYYMALIYSWFYFNGDEKYKQFIKDWIKDNLK